ncbi:MAG: hypothetical protein AAF327_07890 [Cyanobacteria bacterium P01_A01_bin.37]
MNINNLLHINESLQNAISYEDKSILDNSSVNKRTKRKPNMVPKRNKKIEFRVTISEHQRIREQAQGETISSYIRELILKHFDAVPALIDRQFYVQLCDVNVTLQKHTTDLKAALQRDENSTDLTALLHQHLHIKEMLLEQITALQHLIGEHLMQGLELEEELDPVEEMCEEMTYLDIETE